MKFACALLVLTVVFAAPQKRILLDDLLNVGELKTLVGQLIHTAASQETEKQCEGKCHDYIKQDHLLQFACPLVCNSLKSLAHRFDIVASTAVPVTATPTAQ